MRFFVPDVRFVLHRSEPAENEGTTLATRGRALETRLLDYLRRTDKRITAHDSTPEKGTKFVTGGFDPRL